MRLYASLECMTRVTKVRTIAAEELGGYKVISYAALSIENIVSEFNRV
jgi:hypothetical protein